VIISHGRRTAGEERSSSSAALFVLVLELGNDRPVAIDVHPPHGACDAQ
jgi:hypothetical protein